MALLEGFGSLFLSKCVRCLIYYYNAGFRIEDLYSVKFHKEPYVLMHMYSQYFHPHTLLERVRNVAFYRRPRTIYKGFTVPDWARAENSDGWEFDFYSQQAW